MYSYMYIVHNNLIQLIYVTEGYFEIQCPNKFFQIKSTMKKDGIAT